MQKSNIFKYSKYNSNKSIKFLYSYDFPKFIKHL